MQEKQLLQEVAFKNTGSAVTTGQDIVNIIKTSGLSKHGKFIVDNFLSYIGSGYGQGYISQIIPYTPLKNGKPNEKYIKAIGTLIEKIYKAENISQYPVFKIDSKEYKKVIDVAKTVSVYFTDPKIRNSYNMIGGRRGPFGSTGSLVSMFDHYMRDMVKKALDLKNARTQEILANTAANIAKKADAAKKVKDTLTTTINVAAKNVAETAKVAADIAKDPAKFYPMIVRQGDLLEKYAKVTPAASNALEVKKAADNIKKITEVTKDVKVAEKGGELIAKKGGNLITKNAVQETVKAISGGKSKIISGIIVTVATLASSVLIAGWREKSSIAKVKELTENALNSKNYQDLAKYIGLLKKMQAKNTLMDKLMVADAASQLAGTNIENLKKGYTIMGATLIAASIVVCLLVGVTGQVISSLKEIVSNFSFNSVLNAIGKLAVLGILLAPALVGICLIKVAQDGFTEEGPAAFIVSMLAPVVSLSNYCIKGVLELIENAEQNQINNSGGSKYINNIDSDRVKYVNTLKKLRSQIDGMLAKA